MIFKKQKPYRFWRKSGHRFNWYTTEQVRMRCSGNVGKRMSKQTPSMHHLLNKSWAFDPYVLQSLHFTHIFGNTMLRRYNLTIKCFRKEKKTPEFQQNYNVCRTVKCATRVQTLPEQPQHNNGQVKLFLEMLNLGLMFTYLDVYMIHTQSSGTGLVNGLSQELQFNP